MPPTVFAEKSYSLNVLVLVLGRSVASSPPREPLLVLFMEEKRPAHPRPRDRQESEPREGHEREQRQDRVHRSPRVPLAARRSERLFGARRRDRVGDEADEELVELVAPDRLAEDVEGGERRSEAGELAHVGHPEGVGHVTPEP